MDVCCIRCRYYIINMDNFSKMKQKSKYNIKKTMFFKPVLD